MAYSPGFGWGESQPWASACSIDFVWRALAMTSSWCRRTYRRPLGAVSYGRRSESIICGTVDLLTPKTVAASSVVAQYGVRLVVDAA